MSFGVPLRRGKWTQEEEAYVDKIISCFNDGTLQATPGVTLRAFLSEKVRESRECDARLLLKIQ